MIYFLFSLQSWERRENELSFLWGTEDLSDSQVPRHAFIGRPKVLGFPVRSLLGLFLGVRFGVI